MLNDYKKVYISMRFSKLYSSPQYDLSRGNAGHPFFLYWRFL